MHIGMTQRFHHQDTDYVAWLHAHQRDGYVLNMAGSETRLHRAGCDHLWRPIREGRRLTADYPKTCSTSLANLTPLLGAGRRCPSCAP
jgi:hypothetical protein